MGNPSLASLINPYGLNAPVNKPREMSLPEISLRWGLDPVGTGMDAIDLADMAGQFGVGLGGDMPQITGGDTSEGQAFRTRLLGEAVKLAGAAPAVDAAKGAAVAEGQLQAEVNRRLGMDPPGTDETASQPPQPGAAAPLGPQVMTLGSSSSTSSGMRVDPRQMAAGQGKIDEGAAIQQAAADEGAEDAAARVCLLYTSPSPRDA